MLILKDPIKLNNRNILAGGSDSLYNRISENYSLMSASIAGEDLMHMVTKPPEFFYAEGDATTIFNQNTNINSVQERKVEIINNLINRIMISNTTDFTYQDRVYITSILKKLGIRDEKTFMTHVNNLIEDNSLTQVQLKLLENSVKQLKERNLIADDGNGSGISGVVDRHTESTNNEFYLHQDILERNNIENNTRFVRNYLSSTNLDDRRVSNTELINSENVRMENHLHMQRLQNEIMGQNLPMIFNHSNYYEDVTLIDEENIEESVNQSLSEAVLLSVIDNVLQARSQNINNNRNDWYYIANSLYNTTDTTIKRYTDNLVNPIYSNVLNEFYKAEESNITEVRNYFNQLEQNIENITLQHAEFVNNETTELSSTQEAFNSVNEQINNVTETVNEITEAQITHVDNSSTEFNEYTATTEEMLAQLNLIEQHNIENRNQYIRALNNLRDMQQKAQAPRKGSRRRQREESLRALENPAELLHDFRQEAESDAMLEAQRKQEAMQLLPPDVRQYMEIIERFGSDPVARERAIMASGDAISSLNADIQEVELRQRSIQTNLPGEVTVTESFREQAKEIVENVVTNRSLTHNEQRHIDEHMDQMAFVHKDTQVIDEEEILNRIDEERQIVNNYKTVTNEVNENVTQINKTEITKEVVQQVVESGHITTIVRDNVRDQLSQLSDQVYSKLEKRLQNEKRRRGL